MSEQAGTHSVPLSGEGPERTPELETPRSAAVPFEPITTAPQARPGRGWRPWAIVGVAIAVPAGVAAALVLSLGGGDSPAEAPAAPAAAPAATAVVERPATATTAPAVATPPAAAPTPAAASTAPARPSADRAAAAAAPAAPSTTQANASETAAATTVAALATPEERLMAWAEMVTVTIVDGDSVWGLALEYDTTVEAIALVNSLADPTALSVGDTLSIPVGFAEALTPAEAPVAEQAASAEQGAAPAITQFETAPPADTALADWPNLVEWTIEPGDYLQALAITFDTTPEAIMALNGMDDPDVLYVGTTISIPVGFNGAVEAEAATPGEESAAAGAEPTTMQAAATTTGTEEAAPQVPVQQEATTTAGEATTTQATATTTAGEETTVPVQQEATTTAGEATDELQAAAPAAEDDSLQSADSGSAADSDDYLEGAAADTGADGDYLEG